MNRVKFGLIAGLVFAVLDIAPMFWLDIPEKNLAIVGAFIARFSVGFLIPLVAFPIVPWIRGLFWGVLLSLPDAIITHSPIPIMTTGIIGGLVIGIILGRIERKAANASS
jgi:hypothetical protein